MKGFLVLFTLISFVTMSCAGPTKVGWTKPDFRQDQHVGDQKEHSEPPNNSPTFWQVLRLLVSYKDNPDVQEPMSVGEVVLIPVMVAAQLSGLAIGIVARGGVRH